MTQQSVHDLVGRDDTPLLLDVRTREEFGSGRVPGAVNILHTELAGRLDEIDQDRDRGVIVYCERGGRAGKAAEILLNAGFPEVGHLEGDMSRWRDAGLPSEH